MRIITDRYGKTIEVEEVAYHRNGISGEGFYAVAFTDKSEELSTAVPMVGVVFDYSGYADERAESPEQFGGTGRVAVMSRSHLNDGVVTFGVNSWRGDRYATVLYQAINEWTEDKESNLD